MSHICFEWPHLTGITNDGEHKSLWKFHFSSYVMKHSIKEFLAIYRHTNTLPHNSYIVELLEVVLTNNYFDFNGKHYHQI